MEAFFLGIGLEGTTKGLLAFGHLVGLVLGLGTAAYLDGGCFLSIARGSWDGYRSFMNGALFGIATRFVMIGLGLLWITGCGFLIHYSVFDPGKLANTKLYAKLAVVLVLTVNGYALHYLVLKRVAKMGDCGQLLRSNVGTLCLLSGAVSSASWIGAFLLGALPMLNHGFDLTVFAAAWAALVLILYTAARVALTMASRRERAGNTVLPNAIGTRDLQAILVNPMTTHAVAATGSAAGGARSGDIVGRTPRPRSPRPSKASFPA